MTAGTIAVVVMAKLPSGDAKTRLAPALGPDERAALARAMLADKVDQVRAVEGARAVVAFAPESARAAMAAIVGDDVDLVPQRGADLGERLAHAAEDVLATGAAGALLVDGDTPTLPIAHLSEGVKALQQARDSVVLGPAWDGGYWAIGMRRPHPELFRDIEWSSSRVLAQTVQRAKDADLALHFLPAWFDVDRPRDLERLAQELARTPSFRHGDPARTRAVLSRLPSPPLSPPRDEKWRTLSTRLAYQNAWLRIHENVVDLGDGRLTLYGIITTGSCVGVVPLVDRDTVLLVRQFRYVARQDTWEIPTGGAHRGERLEEAAQRELREETGFAARTLEHLSTFHTSKSVMDEVAHLYLGEGLYDSRADESDETEEIETRAFPVREAVAMVEDGIIVDSMSVIGILAAARKRRW